MVELEARWALKARAKHEIGHYHGRTGPLPRWPRLRPAPIREKMRLGYAPPDNPLPRTGALRGGITRSVSRSGEKIEARVGVNGVAVVMQERGNRTVPARSYLERGARRKEKHVAELVSAGLRRALRLP